MKLLNVLLLALKTLSQTRFFDTQCKSEHNMWGPNQTSSGPPMPPLEGGSKRSNEFRVVERVAYAHPVRDHHVYYAPKGGSQYEQRPPPPLPPPHNNQVQQATHMK